MQAEMRRPKQFLVVPLSGSPARFLRRPNICIGPFNSENEAKNVASYISCKLTRFLVMLHKPSQHATKRVYSFVPKQNFSQPWSDQKLYAKYGLNDKEIEFIEWMIRPMGATGELFDQEIADEGDDE